MSIHETIRTLVRGGVDLTTRQIHLLFTLDTAPGKAISLGALADTAKLSRPLVSRAAERLVKGGYIVRSRDAADHRLVLVALTPNGEKFLSGMRRGALRDFAAALSKKNVDLTLRQLFAVSACAAEPRTIRWLAGDMNVVKPAISRGIDRLESEGYVRRQEDGDDRRSVLVAILPKGRRFIESVMPTLT